MNKKIKDLFKSVGKKFGIISAQVFLVFLVLSGVSFGTFRYILQNCENWIWRREVSLFISLIKDPFLSILGNDEQLLFDLAGSFAIGLIIISIVSVILMLNLLFLNLCHILEKFFVKKPLVVKHPKNDEERNDT